MNSPLAILFFHELRLAIRGKGQALAVLAFFVVASSLFPFTFGIEPGLLKQVGSGILWVVTLLSITLALPALFERDAGDGTLEQYRLLPLALEAVIAAKCLALWVACLLPLVAALPLIAQLYQIPWELSLKLALSLLPGTLAMIFMGAALAAMSVGLRGGGSLPALLSLPLFLPILVFGYAYAVKEGSGFWSIEWLILNSLALMALALGSLLSAMLLRE